MAGLGTQIEPINIKEDNSELIGGIERSRKLRGSINEALD